MTALIKPYVPILRSRSAEMTALEKLFPSDRSNMTPLIEFIMPAPSLDKKSHKVIKTPREKFLQTLPDIANNLVKVCSENSVFIDVHLLDGDIRASSLDQILSSSNQLSLFSIPVIYIIPVASTSADMETRMIAVNFAKSTGHGLCIRIDKSHLGEPDLSSRITDFVNTHELDLANTDLLVDLRVIDPSIDPGDIVKELAQLPNLDRWRSFIVSGGVFPKDLTNFAAGEVHELERMDWKLWKDIQESELVRKPFFSDYTIQHPVYEYVAAIGSASIRYTSDQGWWIFRGRIPGLINRKTKEKGPGREQYIGHARTLVKREFYKKEGYSFGDAEVARIAAADNEKPGSPATWLAIGINHHLTLVARQISSLYEQPGEHF